MYVLVNLHGFEKILNVCNSLCILHYTVKKKNKSQILYIYVQ